MFRKQIKRGLCCTFAVGLCLTMTAGVEGARVAGEDDVTPTASTSREENRGAGKKKPESGVKDPARPAARRVESGAQDANRKSKDAPQGQKTSTRYVTIDFDDVDIALFIKFISDLTGKNFVIDQAVKGKVNIISPSRISVAEAYRVFESVLEVHGYTTVPTGRIIKIVPAVQARTKSVKTLLREEAYAPEDKVITQVVPLVYADPDRLKALFAPLISKNSVIVSYPPTGMLIVTDVQSNIRRLLRLIRVIDVEGIGEEISVVPLNYATAAGLSKSLSSVFQRRVGKDGKGAAAKATITIAADERTNSLIIVASEDDSEKVKRLIELLDKEMPPAEGDIQVYYLKHANAEDLSKVLMAIPAKQGKQPAKGEEPVLSKDVQIVADKATNALVITAGKDDYGILEEVIKKLDIARRMVYIESAFVEVDVNKNFDLGVVWLAADQVATIDGRDIVGFGGSNPPARILPAIGPEVTGVGGFPLGFSLGVIGDNISIAGVQFPGIQAAVRALRTDSDVHILSTPQLLTADNEEAQIVVAENIPFLTRQDLTTVTDRTFNTYEFRDVGVTLTITPQINYERTVRLTIAQEISQVVEQEEIGLPTTLKRSAKTTVVIKDGQTVVLGGLIDETLNQTHYKVPCLGDIPWLGWLFKSVSRGKGETDLYFFMTPHIIASPLEADDIYYEKEREIDRIREETIKMYEGRPAPKDW